MNHTKHFNRFILDSIDQYIGIKYSTAKSFPIESRVFAKSKFLWEQAKASGKVENSICICNGSFGITLLGDKTLYIVNVAKNLAGKPDFHY